MTDLLSRARAVAQRESDLPPTYYSPGCGARMQRSRYADLVRKRRSATAGCIVAKVGRLSGLGGKPATPVASIVKAGADDISMSRPQLSYALDSRGDANT
jgi:hypothetical protein